MYQLLTESLLCSSQYAGAGIQRDKSAQFHTACSPEEEQETST